MTPYQYTFLAVWVVPGTGVLMLVNDMNNSTKTLVAYLAKQPVIIKKRRQLEES